MVGGQKRSPHTPLMGNHQKCWLWGRHSVLELLRADRWRPLEIGVDRSLPKAILQEVHRWANDRQCPIACWSPREMQDRCHAQDHQGLIARMPEFPYLDVDSLIGTLSDHSWCVLLDGVQDPFNFGAILRSAEVLGAAAVFVGQERQCGVTAQVVRSSAGAVLHVPLARGERAGEIAKSLRAHGYQLVGASEKGTLAPEQIDLLQSTCLVIGNEGSGLTDEMQRCCQTQVSIPQRGRVGSLNAAVAAGILFYEITRQRRSQ